MYFLKWLWNNGRNSGTKIAAWIFSLKINPLTPIRKIEQNNLLLKYEDADIFLLGEYVYQTHKFWTGYLN